MSEAGTIDEEAFGKLPEAGGESAVFLTEEQETKAKDFLTANWAAAIS